MNTADTLAQHLMDTTCPECHCPLGRFHVYQLRHPNQVLSQLADHDAAHLGCIMARLISRPDPTHAIVCIATVKTASATPSGRIIMMPDLDTSEMVPHIHLFTPDTLHFVSFTAEDPTPRSATPEQILQWLQPAIAESMSRATSAAESRAILHQLGLIKSRLPQRDRDAFAAYLSHTPSAA